VPVVIVELRAKATRRLQMADWRPLLAAEKRQALTTLRQVHRVEPIAPRQKTADWRPPLLVTRQASAMLRRGLFVWLE